MKASFPHSFRLLVSGLERPSGFSRWRAAARILVLSLACFDWGGRPLNSQEAIVQSAPPPIVLRDLTLIRGKSIAEFDDSSIVLSDGTRLSWDQILKATVENDRQSAFELKLKQIGLPLFRLKSRIGNGDWIAAGAIAGPIYEASIAGGESAVDQDTAYLVCLATMKSRIHQSDRAGALIPFIRATQLQPKASPKALKIAGDQVIPKRDLELVLSHELLPIWFDNSKLEETDDQLTALLEASTAETSPQPPTGITIYQASLKIELGETEQALRLLRSLSSNTDPEIIGWQTVLQARLHQKTNNPLNAQTTLELNAKKITGAPRLVAFYYLGNNVVEQADTSDFDRSKAILTLLRIPAIYGDTHRDLAAAAIYQSAAIAKLRGRDSDEQIFRDELLKRYPRTYHGLLESNQRSGR